jgi:hypothetical protein
MEQETARIASGKPITKFTNERGKLFVKAFLIDSSVNLNQWAVTEESIPKNINTFIGKPLVLTKEFDHPGTDQDTLKHWLKFQEDFRVGTIINITPKHNSDTGSTAYYAVIEVTDKALKDSLQNNDVPHYVSPAIAQPVQTAANLSPAEAISEWTGIHLAIVDEPAYGVKKAAITETCGGDREGCLLQLMKAQLDCNFCRYEALKEYRIHVLSASATNTSHAQKNTLFTKNRMSQLESMDSPTTKASESKEVETRAVEKVEEPKLLNKQPVPQVPKTTSQLLDELETERHKNELLQVQIRDLTEANGTFSDRLAALELRDRRKDIERIVTPDIIKDEKARLGKIKELVASSIPIAEIENLYKEMKVLVKKASINQRASGVRVPYVTSNLSSANSSTTSGGLDGEDDGLTPLEKQLACINGGTL